MIFTVIFKGKKIDEYEGINAIAYYIMIFRLSTGDFGVDNYKDETSYLGIVAWLIWLVAVLVLNIVLMNFLIAVISESYERVMQKLVAESYKVKVNMIVEKE